MIGGDEPGELSKPPVESAEARFPLIYIPTWEETRATSVIYETVTDSAYLKRPRKLFLWSQTRGMRCETDAGDSKPEIKAPLKALEAIEASEDAAVYLLLDFHYYLGAGGRSPDYTVLRKLRDLVSSLKASSKSVILLSPTLVLPDDLQKDVTVLDFDLPDLQTIQSLLREMIEVNQGAIHILLSDAEQQQLCKAALGLTQQEAENAFARAMVERGCLTIQELEIILDEKCQVIRKQACWNLLRVICA